MGEVVEGCNSVDEARAKDYTAAEKKMLLKQPAAGGQSRKAEQVPLDRGI